MYAPLLGDLTVKLPVLVIESILKGLAGRLLGASLSSASVTDTIDWIDAADLMDAVCFKLEPPSPASLSPGFGIHMVSAGSLDAPQPILASLGDQ